MNSAYRSEAKARSPLDPQHAARQPAELASTPEVEPLASGLDADQAFRRRRVYRRPLVVVDAAPPEPFAIPDLKSPASQQSEAFHLLDERLQQWARQRGWTALVDIQEHAARPIVEALCDVLISAPTASGKTEAAFLPALTRVCSRGGTGIRVLVLSPLKALINDQVNRLRTMCLPLGLRVEPWHGDVSTSRKRRVTGGHADVLVMTPESLEARFVLGGPAMPELLGDLEYIVVDELHSYFDNERGRQLQALLHRVEVAISRRLPRIALSATLGDVELAAAFLRPTNPESVVRIVSDQPARDVCIGIHGYHHDLLEEELSDPDDYVIEHLARRLSVGRHLVFANRRADVEAYTQRLQQARPRGKYLPHHGSLSARERHAAERELREGVGPATVVATNTLELGIDIGTVESISQLGAPPSVSSMRQRLGRSGRTPGAPSIYRIYNVENAKTSLRNPAAGLAQELVRSAATVNLFIRGWCEPRDHIEPLHLSTLVQQTLSLIASWGFASADDIWSTLCSPLGPFPAVHERELHLLLAGLHQHDLLMTGEDERHRLTERGTRVVRNWNFYSAFTTPVEFRVVNGAAHIGSMVRMPWINEGDAITLGARHWVVLDIDPKRRIMRVAPTDTPGTAMFQGGAPLVHCRVRQEMLEIYRGQEEPRHLDLPARLALRGARAAFGALGLHSRSLVGRGATTHLFPWAGDRVGHTVALQLEQAGVRASSRGLFVQVESGRDHVVGIVQRLAMDSPADALELAMRAGPPKTEKHHRLLSRDLLAVDYASRALDVDGAHEALVRIAARS